MPSRAKIAIVEDDLAIVQMYRFKFETDGYEVESAGDGVTGLKLIKDFQPDIVLLDVMMPNMNGLQMLERLRQADWGKHTRVIVLTNAGDPEIARQAEALGAEEVILKASMTPRQVADRIKFRLAHQAK